jgi:two-component system cell cycle sensor histidine kinase PleC
MTVQNSTWVTDLQADEEREKRIQIALLRGVVESIKSNRLVAPIFGLAVCAMFSQSVGMDRLVGWYTQLLIGIVPQIIVLRRIPAGTLGNDALRKWSLRVAMANLLVIASWSSLGVWLWRSGDTNSNHIMIELLLAATFASHAAITGGCRAVARPSLLLYLVVLTAVPVQGLFAAETFTRSACMVAVAPLYVGFVALISSRNRKRARAAIMLAQERDTLMAELVMAKLESDRGREQAEAANRAKSQFLANMSHELRTPLNAILGFSEIISSRIFTTDEERTVEYANLIHGSGKHLLALINDILDLAKIEAGRWQLQEAELSLHAVASDALQQVMWRAQNDKIVLENTVDPALETVFADERSIKQILLNLLSNAVKFTPENGSVKVFARRQADGGMMVGVTDTGIGIAPEDQAKVFDSFGQGKHDVAIADKGTGLGLTIVKGLAEAHGGSVHLKSEVGVGTTVTLRLPAARVMARKLPQAGRAA